jgi:hypothetical protein
MSGGPSPKDIVHAYKNLYKPDLVAGGAVAINYYKNNFSVTIVTSDADYMVTVKDWDAMPALTNSYYENPKATNDQFTELIDKYYEVNDSYQPTKADATIYAALKMYGNAVNITKREVGEQFKPLSINDRGRIDAKNCN